MSALNLLEPSIKIAEVTALQCMSSAGAGQLRVRGITTPKEFKSIIGAIAFAKTLSYPITIDLMRSLAGIGRQSNNKRVHRLISAILELNQIHDDVYTDNCRQIYRDKSGEYLLYPDGSIDRDSTKGELDLVKKIETLKKENVPDENKSVSLVEPIAYRDHESNTFISELLSSSFLSDINGGTVADRGSRFDEDPLRFYRIDPYRVHLNNFGIDPKEEMYKLRLIHHLLDKGLDKNNIFDLRTFKDAIGMLLGYVALKHLPQYKKNLRSSRSIEKHGKHLFDIYVATASKNGYVGHRAPSIRFFSEKTLVEFHNDLFTVKKVPMANHFYKVYVPTNTLHRIAEEVFDFVFGLKFAAPENTVIIENNYTFSFLLIDMHKINIRDRMCILSHALGVKDGRVWVNIKPDDNHFNRVYSLMTTIKSESRISLYEHDISTCQQVIMMNIVDDNECYPIHKQLIDDKYTFRENIQSILGCDYDKAKEHITAISNGRELDYYKGRAKRKLQPFHLEAQKLADTFLYTVEYNDPYMFNQAVSLAKEAKKDDFAMYGKKKYGLLFHLYTHYERQIRSVMKSCFTAPVYDVHDAVYSRKLVSSDILEQEVLKKTGFEIKIETSDSNIERGENE